MNACTHQHRDYGFMIGLLTGTFAGAGLALWLVPRVVAELRQRRDDLADVVARGAHEVERQAMAAKS